MKESFNKRLQNRRIAERVSQREELYIEHFTCKNPTDLYWVLKAYSRKQIDCVVFLRCFNIVEVKQISISVAEEYLQRNVEVRIHIKEK